MKLRGSDSYGHSVSKRPRGRPHRLLDRRLVFAEHLQNLQFYLGRCVLSVARHVLPQLNLEYSRQSMALAGQTMEVIIAALQLRFSKLD